MGIKMTKALYNNAPIDISQATVEMRNNKLLKCSSTSTCNAQVTWVSKHRKNFDIETKFFRLLPNEVHDISCKYNTVGRLEIIARQADKNILRSLENGSREFRINLICDALEELKKIDVQETNQNENKDENKIQKTYIAAKNKLTSYLALMKDIMKMRAELENNNELSKLIKLNLGDKKISWANFYYEFGDEEEIYKYIFNTKNSNNNNKIYLNHPVCIEGTIKKINQVSDKYYINIKPRKYTSSNNNNEKIVYQTTLMTNNQEIIDSLKEDMDIISYFIPYIDLQPLSKLPYINYYVRGWLNYEDQISIL